MSAVIGETDYQATFWQDRNSVSRSATEAYYCAGCNGSFRLLFGTTSVGTSAGVYGAGFDFFNASATVPYYAFVTFGDASTANYALPFVNTQPTTTAFFGITSDLLISSIHLGLANGQSTHQGAFGIDNLTIGTQGAQGPQSVPDAASSLTLFVAGLTGLSFVKRRRRQ